MLASKPRWAAPLGSPDENAAGLFRGTLDSTRYAGERSTGPDAVGGIAIRMVPSGSRVLDVGCGTGDLARLLGVECRAKVVGIEPDPVRAERAASAGIQVYTGYLTPELASELGQFDVVLFADVLEHVPNPQALLLLARAVLKPGGSLVVSVPNVAHWSVRLCLLRGKFEYWSEGIMDATHLRWFTAKTIMSLLESAGFRPTEYRATAGPGLPDNAGRAPMRWLSATARDKVLRYGCRHWPTLFGAQHVLKAQMV